MLFIFLNFILFVFMLLYQILMGLVLILKNIVQPTFANARCTYIRCDNVIELSIKPRRHVVGILYTSYKQERKILRNKSFCTDLFFASFHLHDPSELSHAALP